MPIPVSCPSCGAKDLLPENFQGSTVPCKSCGKGVFVPHMHAPVAKSGGGMGVGMILLAIGGVMLVLMLACGGILVALLLPAVQASREAAMRMRSSNNIKQIMLAMHNYHDSHGEFPPAYLPDENGKPKHSWRVLLLPYLEAQGLYQQYNMDEPWDSPNNRSVAATMPQVYRSEIDAINGTSNGVTSYLLIAGKGTAFAPGTKSTLGSISDGTSNTIGVIEVNNSGILWTQPDDLDAEKLDFVIRSMKDAVPGQINTRRNGTMAGFLDGSVRFIPQSINPNELRKAATSAGGEVLTLP